MFGFKSKQERRLEKIEKIADLERKRNEAGKEYTAYMDEKRTDQALAKREKKVKEDYARIKTAEFRAKTEGFRQFGERAREYGTKIKAGYDVASKKLTKSPMVVKAKRSKAQSNNTGVFGIYSAPPLSGGSFGSAPPLFSSSSKGSNRDFITGAPLNSKRRLL